MGARELVGSNPAYSTKCGSSSVDRARSFQVGDEGSIPFIRSRGKRYPIDLVPFLNNGIVVAFHDFIEGVRRSLGVTNPPSMFDFFYVVRH